jgi:exodeoxyribonuclease VII small subunit|tara:strand:+ start:405 stop:722 length:318 start_codon:yes stop_codon:yes gene_type:complete
MARKQAKSSDAGSFEDAMVKLEALVEAMENDQLPLEELVAHYEKGAGLLQHCEKVLAAARKRIELIEVGNSPEKGLTPEIERDENSGEVPRPHNDVDPDDDIRLL